MAITINSQPSSYSSMHSPLYYVVTSDNTSETNFKYVCDIYVGGNLVARLKSFPQPTNSKGIFDVSRVVRDYWNSYFKPNTTPTAFSYITSDIYVNYEIKFGEEYDGTTYLNLEEADAFAYNFYPDFFNKSITAPLMRTLPSTVYFLTNRDRINIQFDKNKLLTQRSFITYKATLENTDVELNLEVNTFTGSTSVAAYTGAKITMRDIALLDISPQAINTYLGTSAISANVDRYFIEIYEDDAAIDGFQVNLDCFPKSESLNLHFLNALGGYDTMNFLLVNRQSRAGQKKSFSALEYELNTSTSVMDRFNSNNVFYGGAKQFWGEQSISFKLTSNWVNQTDYTWLKELIYSPEVYLEWNGYYLPVNITDSAWQEKKNYQDKQFNLELNVELASKVNSQFR